MSLYMTQFSYTPEAWAALVKNPENREPQLSAMLEKLGGRLISFYYCYGKYDGVAIYESPDETTAMAGVLAAIAPGHLKGTKTTVLLSVADAMKGMERAGSIAYKAPKV